MNRTRRTLSLLLALLMLASLFSGCAKQDAGKKNGQDSTGNEQNPSGSGQTTTPDQTKNPAKDTLIFSINADITTLDCHMARDTVTGIVQYQMYDGLVRNQPGEGLVPGLAESWEFSADNKELTFTIRQGVKFHNGDTMTAEDVAFSLNRAIASSFTASYSGTMDRAEVVDDTHVKLYMKQAFGPVLQCLSAALYEHHQQARRRGAGR